ncbi:hypothetical protein GCM10007423_04100 [Dyadobacter endophyticus]|uniref:Uncharacterized protein n=1 Tax=Dyadobacter endophyticus TaxID=1749036 RepID=A0ABQ1YDR1_9BACT|nr:hypothetical protein GCM10007423_04100 [Dyadobacter endophyticus]
MQAEQRKIAQIPHCRPKPEVVSGKILSNEEEGLHLKLLLQSKERNGDMQIFFNNLYEILQSASQAPFGN